MTATIKEHFNVAVPCEHKPGHTHLWPIGETDPKQYECGHLFEITNRDGIECRACHLFISGEQLHMLKWLAGERYSKRGQALADDNTRLMVENVEVLAENARLRRRIEALERKR